MRTRLRFCGVEVESKRKVRKVPAPAVAGTENCGGTKGCSTGAKTGAGADWVAPVTVYVVRDAYGRRVGTNGDVEDHMRCELSKLSLREAAIRVARDQLASRVRTNEQGQSLYNLPKGYGGLWCGAFAARATRERLPREFCFAGRYHALEN